MSKKIELTLEQITECLKMYNEELLGSTTISQRMGIHKTIIIRTLKENGVVLGPSGRRNIGGKSVADKKYREKTKKNLKSITNHGLKPIEKSLEIIIKYGDRIIQTIKKKLKNMN